MSVVDLLEELINVFDVDRYPLVSIILPMYNAKNYICNAVQSIIDQTYLHWELIIIDDGSNDNSLKIIERNYINSNRHGKTIKLIKLKENQGIVNALNIGISECDINSKYIARMDADDIALYNRIEKQIEFSPSNFITSNAIFPMYITVYMVSFFPIAYTCRIRSMHKKFRGAHIAHCV